LKNTSLNAHLCKIKLNYKLYSVVQQAQTRLVVRLFQISLKRVFLIFSALSANLTLKLD
jgi:hypothetical protein